jgi:hypothetical protein
VEHEEVEAAGAAEADERLLALVHQAREAGAGRCVIAAEPASEAAVIAGEADERRRAPQEPAWVLHVESRLVLAVIPTGQALVLYRVAPT